MFNEEGPLRRIPLPMALVLLMKFLLSILKITNEGTVVGPQSETFDQLGKVQLGKLPAGRQLRALCDF